VCGIDPEQGKPSLLGGVLDVCGFACQLIHPALLRVGKVFRYRFHLIAPVIRARV
jgi:hypothetical protein